MNTIIDKENLLNLLPHGSGIDFNWEIIRHKNGNITAKNYFHAMNEYGYYDGIMPFKVLIYRSKKDRLNPLTGPCAGKIQVLERKGDIQFKIVYNKKRKRSFYELGEYLYDTIRYSLETILTHRNEII